MLKSISNASVWIDGTLQLGTCSEFELPKMKHLLVENKGLGLIGTPEAFGGIDKLEATFTWNSFDKQTHLAIANPTKPVQLQVRSSQKESTLLGDTEVPVVVFLTGIFKTVPFGKLKKGDNLDLDSEMTVSYIRLLLNGEELVEIDIYSNRYRINGTDILSQWRSNLGLS